jgi:asparagine synthase (glutamine-hydrolysing)
MCGIAGSFAFRADAVAPEVLVRVRDAMRVRGPDGEGLWFDASRRVGLAHRRLSILDLSPAGSQPMTRGDLTLVFNGEIYNFRSLRLELEQLGHRFQSNSDTEVLLAMWAQYGPAALARLRGMFAFALWDARARQLVLARDPLGIKPLYWGQEDRGVVHFASQVRALALAPVDTRPEPAGHAGFLLWGSVPEPWTLYRGIHALPAGHWMVMDDAGVGQPRRYADLERALGSPPAEGLATEQALATVSGALEESVGLHLEADVPVGVFLSAGLDSTLLAALAARRGSGLVTTTLGFDRLRGTEGDETALAESVARQLATDHRTHWVGRDDFLAQREHILGAMDQPSIDGINTWFVARAAAGQGLKVALSGLGGDELFASYPSFTDVPRIVSRMGPLARVPGLGRAFRWISAPWLARMQRPKYAGLIEYGADEAGAYLLRRGLYMPWELPSVMDPDMARQGWQRLQVRSQLAQSSRVEGPQRLRLSSLEMGWYMRNQLLRDADWAGMAHSLEIRVPLADWGLVGAVSPLLAAHPSLTKPEIARAAAAELPQALFARRKTGFAVPVHEWLTGARVRGGAGMRHWACQVHRHFMQVSR